MLVRAFAVAAFLASGVAVAAPITKTLSVGVYQLCNDAGANCASLGPAGDAYYAAETNKIWAQAGIAVIFNFLGQINSTNFSNTDDSVPTRSFTALSAAYGAAATTTSTTAFLVHTATTPFGQVYGQAYYGAGGLEIAMDLVGSFNSGIGRLDTIAHELGHNLGLVSPALGGDAGGHSAQANYLMADGGNRTVPSSLGDIAPSGLGLDVLPADQIAAARQSALLRDVPVPEPMTGVLLLGAVGIAGMLRRRG